MRNPMATAYDETGGDFQRRCHYSLTDFDAKEPQTSNLRLLRDLWNRLKEPASPPLIDNFLNNNVIPLKQESELSLIDVSSPSPWFFLFLQHCKSLETGPFVNLEKTHVRDFQCSMHARALMNEYLYAREIGKPIYHEIEIVMSGISRHYMRLILPLADTGGEVTRLLIGKRDVGSRA